MDYQIFLLPRERYWDWLRACKDYVLTFGTNLTPNPETAAGYMAPRQVISFPLYPEGFPAFGEIERWFLEKHPGIRLDPIPVSSPRQLQEELDLRIEDHDRYGQLRKSFHLVWPTDYAVVTQPYRANPHIYGRWGMPGHEGVDLRARTNSNIYSCAEGEIYRVHLNPRDHPYGIHVRIRHKDSYKTVYAHLAKTFVSVGDQVQSGEIIGRADATGASTGSHLHLTLKRDGATEREETDYPKDILDPTPFLIWPNTDGLKSASLSEWPHGSCLIGVHGRIRGAMSPEDLDAIGESRVEAVKLDLEETLETLQRIKSIHPAMFIVVRLGANFSNGPVSAEHFVSNVEPEMGRFYRSGIRYFEVLSAPNLQSEGWRRSWMNGKEFGDWFRDVTQRLRKTYPMAKFGFPGLSPGKYLSGWRADDQEFLIQAEEAVSSADWLGVQVFWNDRTDMRGISGGLGYESYRLRHPDKILMISEFNNPRGDVRASEKGHQYLEYYRYLREQPGLAAAFSYALAASDGFESVVWRNGGKQPSEIAAIVGERSF